MAKKSFRAAIIGTGRIADLYDEEATWLTGLELPRDVVHANIYSVKPVSHAGAYATVDGYELVAAASRGEPRLKDFGRRRGVSALYTDYRAMLAAEKPDVVSICTRSPEKADAVIACAEAGVKAVIVEKAMATSLAETDAMLAAGERAGTFVAMHHPMRFSALFRRVRELAHDGSIGQLSSIAAYSTSTVLHVGTHHFDLIRYLGGDVAMVYARIPGLERDGAASEPLAGTYQDLRGEALLEMRNGVTALLSLRVPMWAGMQVRGSHGYVDAPGNGGLLRLIKARQRPAAEFGLTDSPEASRGRSRHAVAWEEEVSAWPDRGAMNEMSAIQRLLTELYATLTEGAPFVSTGRDGAAALEVCIACYHSALLGRAVELPLAERRLRVLNV